MKRKTPKEAAANSLRDSCRTGSRRPKKINKGIGYCDVTYESMHALLETQQWKCAETNIPFLLLEKRLTVAQTNELGLNRLNLPSADRIDNDKGYTMDNIRIVTNGYNQLRNRYSEADVKEWINAIKSYNNDKSN